VQRRARLTGLDPEIGLPTCAEPVPALDRLHHELVSERRECGEVEVPAPLQVAYVDPEVVEHRAIVQPDDPRFFAAGRDTLAQP